MQNNKGAVGQVGKGKKSKKNLRQFLGDFEGLAVLGGAT